MSLEPDRPAVTSPAAARKILIVDDDQSMLDHLSGMITQSGYLPILAKTWGDALRLYREQQPDLVLLDVMMPGVDGFKLARMLKAEAQKQSQEGQGELGAFLPVLLLTALDDDASKNRGLSAGADDFLHKPVKLIDLQFRLSSMLRIKALTDELAGANSKLKKLAVTDGLTDLANRRHFYQVLEREFARAKRHGHPLCVLVLDIDHFKQVNDTQGHAAGDQVLRKMAEILKSSTRLTDVIARIGGEEFAIVAPDTPPPHMAIFAERVRANVEKMTRGAGLTPVTVSIGGATSHLAGVKNPDELVQIADAALYRAKNAGRNQVVLAEDPAVPQDNKPGE